MNKKSQDTEPNDSTTTVQKVQQYALLNYSILNYHFGLFDECALSIQETIRIAQQNNDHVCLMHATGLLTKLALQKVYETIKLCLLAVFTFVLRSHHCSILLPCLFSLLLHLIFILVLSNDV